MWRCVMERNLLATVSYCKTEVLLFFSPSTDLFLLRKEKFVFHLAQLLFSV